ncbi:MAG: NAD(P)/FAD-dependent oxidoreductase [Cytophagales bacterium]|nr:NAD(P)/FAD-dependent oxidoreductase [Cytophagales bacterium]
MSNQTTFDVIIIGGSNAGLSAGMTLGRAMSRVLIIDSGNPCNKQTPYSHNFLTQDGRTPAGMLEIAKAQVLSYPTVQYVSGTVSAAGGSNNRFVITTADGRHFKSKKLLFATGVRDIMPDTEGFAACWGISVIHCPYCHGYEFKGQPTGILMNGEVAVDFSRFIHNWTDKLTLFTDGKATFSAEERQKIIRRKIRIVEKEIKRLEHQNGYLNGILFTDGSYQPLDALYARPAYEQHSKLPEQLGCTLTGGGHIKVDDFKLTSVAGIYAAGDNSSPMRSVAGAVAAGMVAGAMLNQEFIRERD